MSTSTPIEDALLIRNATVVTVDLEDTVIERGTVRVENGRLIEVRPSEPGDEALSAHTVIDGEGMIVMPGLVNAHAHMELSALHGAFSELSAAKLAAEASAIYNDAEKFSEDLRYAGWRLGILNFVKDGITTFNAMDVDPNPGVPVVGRGGVRAVLGPMVSDLFSPEPVEEQLERAANFVDGHHGSYDGRIQASITPHDDLTLTRHAWERLAALAHEQPDVLVHTHLLELPQSNTMARSNGAKDSVGLLEDLGLLNRGLALAHFVAASNDDADRVAEAGASVLHCPTALSYFGPGNRGWVPIPRLLERGANVALGLDDPYWIDSWDLFREAKQARLMANFLHGAQQFTSNQLLRMLTIDGARALGLGEEAGSLEAGKRADLILLDARQPKFQPLINLPALVVNAASAEDVDTVIVDGQVLMRERRVLTMDEEAVMGEAREAARRFAGDAGWHLSVAGSQTPHTPALARLPKGAAVRWAARLGAQAIKESISSQARSPNP